jgi:Asp-tRNA(Asn)/Glu-tRNA(Gln) amidotransferase A subunit family amidase
MMVDEGNLSYLPATELLRLVRSKSVSPVEITQALLDRIDRLD